MDFALTDEQKEVAALATKIFTDHDASNARDTTALWSTLAGAGLLGVAVREDLGGAGHGLLEHCSLLTAVGAAAAPVPLWAVATAALAIDHAGTPAQRAILKDVLRGTRLITVALHEPDGGDPFAPLTIARAGRLTGVKTSSGPRSGPGREADGADEVGVRQLSGAKTCVPAAGRAARIVVTAVGENGQPALFLIDPASSGVRIEPQVATTGEPQGELVLDGAAAEPLGDAETFGWLLDRATVGLCALELGLVEKVLRMTATYTTQRTQFDRPIATFQAVSQRAADAYVDVETIRLTLWEATWRLAQGLPAARELAVAKIFAAEAGQRVTYAAQHLHGGIGFDLGYPLARYYPLSKWIELTLGGASAHVARLGALLAAG